MNPQIRDSLRSEAASLREDILHLQSRINFLSECRDPVWIAKQLSDVKRKIDALETYAQSLVNAHQDADAREAKLVAELDRKHLRIGRISSLLMSDRRDSSLADSGSGASRSRNIAKRRTTKVGTLSEEKAAELCSNLGISLDDLKALIEKGNG